MVSLFARAFTEETLFDTPQDREKRALAARYTPILRFDTHEPFLPVAAGYTIFQEDGKSPSFRQGYQVELTPQGQPPAALAIEYAIWWDWDIGHLYELEHVWVYVDAQEQVVRVDASWHGEYHDMRHEGQLALEGVRPVLFSEPGKHAFAPTPAWFQERRQHFKRSETRDLAGVGGVLRTPYLRDYVTITPRVTRLVHTHLAQRAFDPAWDFSQRFLLRERQLVPWSALREWIPLRISGILDNLAREISPADYRFLRIGHRGAAGHAPDNTLLSLRRAAELGADMVEFDVRCTADRHPVLAHDPYLLAGEACALPVATHTLAELQALDLGEEQHLATLPEALDLCRAEQLGAYIEIKDELVIPHLLLLLEEREYAAHTILASFRPDWLVEAKTVAPRLATSILFSSPHVDPVRLAEAAYADYVHPCWERFPDPAALLTAQWVQHVREAGLGLIVWHEERPAQLAALRRAGVDGICSDRPELLR